MAFVSRFDAANALTARNLEAAMSFPTFLMVMVESVKKASLDSTTKVCEG